jgi:hypothetical protein
MVQGKPKLFKFLTAVLPEYVPATNILGTRMQSRDELIADILDGISEATMALRMT